MSVSLYWQPKHQKLLETNAASATHDALQRAFGDFPITLSGRDFDQLSGMANAIPSNEAYPTLMELLNQHEEITLFAEW